MSLIFSKRELTFTFAIAVRLSSVTFVAFLRHLVPWPPIDIHEKFHEDLPDPSIAGFKRKRCSQI